MDITENVCLYEEGERYKPDENTTEVYIAIERKIELDNLNWENKCKEEHKQKEKWDKIIDDAQRKARWDIFGNLYKIGERRY